MGGAAPRVRLVSFDFDNTLLLSELCKQRTMREVCDAYEGGAEVLATVPTDARLAPPGVTVTRHTIFRDVAHGLIARGSAGGAEGADALGARLCETFSSTLEARLLEADEVPGAVRLLAHLRAHGVPVFVNTATPQEPVAALVEALGWTGYFRGVLGAPASKVDNLAAALRAEGLTSAEAAVHVGDGDNDCRAARDFGCAFVGVAPAGAAAFSAPCHAVVADMHGAGAVLCELLGVPPVAESAAEAGAPPA